MKRVLTAVVLVPLVLLVVFKAPLWLFALVIAAIAFLGLREYLNMVEAYQVRPMRWLTFTVGLLVIFAGFMQFDLDEAVRLPWIVAQAFHFFSIFMLPIILPLVFGIPLVFRKDLRQGLLSAASGAFGILYIPASLILLIIWRTAGALNVLIVVVLVCVWVGDIAAYYVGRSLGRHKLAPIVSPNKTWEGAIASIVASAVASFFVFHYQREVGLFFNGPVRAGWGPLPLASTSHAIVLGIVVNIAAQFGDLFESAIKRGASIKDSGSLLPGHGGILDRIDALLFAIPAVWYYAVLTRFLVWRNTY